MGHVMRAESLKLLGGALALRRFTARELASYSEVEPQFVEAWIARHPAFFAKHDPRLGAARELSAAARPRLRAIMDGVPERDLEAAYRGHGPTPPSRLDALSHAEAYQELLDEATSGADLQEIWDRFAEWVKVARRQAEGFARAGVAVAPVDMASLALCEDRVSEGLAPARARLDQGAILEWADRYVEAVEAGFRESAQRVAAWALPPDAERARPLVLLAAVALSDRFPVAPDARRCIHETAVSVAASSYSLSLSTILGDPAPGDAAANTIIVILDGARRDHRLLQDDGFARWLEGTVGRARQPRVRDALAMVYCDMPNVGMGHLTTVLRPIVGLVGPTPPARRGPADRLLRAVDAIAGEMRSFANRIAPVGGDDVAMADGLDGIRRRFERVYLKPHEPGFP